MAEVAYDAASNAGADGVTSISWSHTVTAGSNMSIAASAGWLENSITCTSATYNSVSLTSIVSKAHTTQSAIHWYGKSAPSTGSAYTVQLNFSSSASNVVGGAISFSNTNQTTPFNNTATNEGEGTAITNNVLSTAGGLAVEAAFTNGSSAGWTGEQTERWDRNDSAGFTHGGGQTHTDATGSRMGGLVSMDWTANYGKWVSAGFNVQATEPTTRTVTVKSSGGDYTSVAAAETAETANLVSLNRLLKIECYAMEDANFNFSGAWTTDHMCYPWIYVPPAERHDGKWNTSKYRVVGAANTYACDLDLDNFKLEGVQAHSVSTGSAVGVFSPYFRSAGWMGWIIDCVGWGGGANCEGISMSSTNAGSVTVVNTVVYDSRRSFFGGWRWEGNDGNRAHGYNVTMHNCYYNFRNNNSGSGAMYLVNCLSSAGTVNFNGTMATGTDYCASSSATGPGTGSNNRTSQTFSFVSTTVGSEDLHLQSSDAGAKDYGKSLATAADCPLYWHPFTTDIDGETRSGSWDIGADEYVAAAGGGSASYAGAGALTAGAVGQFQGRASQAGAGALTARGARIQPVSGAFAGAGALAVLGARIQPITGALSGAGLLTVDAEALKLIAATFAGSGALVVDSSVLRIAQAIYGGTGLLTVDSSVLRAASAAFAGSGGLVASTVGAAIWNGEAAFAGTGSLAADSLQITTWQGSAAFAGTGSVVAVATQVAVISAVFAGSGLIDVDGSAANVFQGEGVFVAESGLVVSATVLNLETLIYKLLSNRQGLESGKFVVYDDDGTTVLFDGDAWEDTDGTVSYTGNVLRRIDRLTLH